MIPIKSTLERIREAEERLEFLRENRAPYDFIECEMKIIEALQELDANCMKRLDSLDGWKGGGV